MTDEKMRAIMAAKLQDEAARIEVAVAQIVGILIDLNASVSPLIEAVAKHDTIIRDGVLYTCVPTGVAESAVTVFRAVMATIPSTAPDICGTTQKRK